MKRPTGRQSIDRCSIDYPIERGRIARRASGAGVTLPDVLIVHAGNRIDASDRSDPRFPQSQVAAVATRVGRLLDALQPTGVVSAAAAGADLIVLEEAHQRRIPIHVVIPINADQFVANSVADQDNQWIGRYRAVLEHARNDPRSTVWQGTMVEHDRWYLDANNDLFCRATELAGDEPVVALTIRPPGGETPPSATDDFADRAGRAGLLVLSLDPRPGSQVPVDVVQ